MQRAPLDEQAIFHVAIQIPSADVRADYLSRACGDNVALFDRLSALLRAHDERPEFLESPPGGLEATVSPAPAHDDSGTTIGPYKLLQQIGEGGFGVVYMAEQTEPVRRKVALKIIKPGMDTKEVIARFEAERQAVALMNHPNIARILDAGTTDSGKPYFVMELVKGVTVTEYCDTNNLSTRERLTLFAEICRAIQHAHQKGVIHRDLKPSNILVTLHDGRPVPKAIDFGVAKAMSFQLTEKTMFTRYGQVIGTPQYMSPEQAEMSGLDVDTRSDVYSLGVLLYELLTGRPPFDAKHLQDAGIDAMRRMIREKEPVLPSHLIRTLDADTATTVATHRASKPAALSRLVHGELDWIVMKALEKDRNRRYETASSLAGDVDRYLLDDVVLAGPPSMTYRMWKAVKRHRVASWSVAAVSLSLVLGLAVSLFAVRVAYAAQQEADDARRVALAEKSKADDAAREAQTQRDEAEHRSQQARVAASNANQMLNLVLDILSKAKVNPETGRQYTVQEALEGLASNLENETQLPPASIAQLHLALGKAYYLSANAERAKKHLEKARELGEKEIGPDNPLVAKSLRYLGVLGQTPDMLQRAAAIERKTQLDQELAKTLTLLGVLVHRLGERDDAQTYLAEACTLFKSSDPTIPMEEIPFLPMSELLRDRSQVAASNDYHAKAISEAKALFGTNASSWWKQGGFYRKARRYRAYEYACLVLEDLTASDATGKSQWDLSLGFRFLARYDRADQQLRVAIDKSRANNDLFQLCVVLANRARVRCNLHDFQSAESFLREALDVSQQREPADPFTDLWLKYELAMILKERGDSDNAKLQEAKALFEDVAAAIKQLSDSNVTVYDKDADNSLMYECMLWSDQHVATSEFLEAFKITDQGRRELTFNTALLKGLVHRQNGEYEQAVSALETASREKRTWHEIGRDTVFSDWIEEALLDLYIKERELPRAQKFFEELVAARDGWLPEDQPNRAFTRILLARTLVLQQTDLDRAKSLLLEARMILGKHSMMPAGPLNEVNELLAQIEQASNHQTSK